jgi:S1-C subfamily serine protease
MGPEGDEDHEGHQEGRDDDPMGADEDDRPLGAPPDRMDRIWVHPTELSPVRSPSRARARFGKLVMPLAAGALGAIVAIAVLGVLGAFDDEDTPRAGPVDVQFGPGDEAVSQLADTVAPGLVLVTVRDANGTRQASGVCVRHSGEVLTSTEVIGSAESAQITTSDGDLVAATVTGRDPVTGLALLSAERPLRAAPISDVRGTPGDSVWIFGAHPPSVASPWISSGILSSIDAVVAVSPGGPMTRGLLETDALGSVWASGGALVDRTGAVNGIVLAPTLSSRSAYAVPIRTAVTIANELREDGFVPHATMPIEGIDTPAGPTVTAVPPDSPAAAAGIVAGDVIVAIDGREVVDLAHLTAVVHGYRPGNEVEVEVVRAGEPMKLEVTLASTEPPAPPAPPPS